MQDSKAIALYRELLKEISSGKYQPLGVFPSECALARRFHVARGTVRSAKKMLEKNGLLCARRGSGTSVVGCTESCQSIGVLVSGCRYTEIFRCIGKVICERGADAGLRVLLGDASRLNAQDAPPYAFDVAGRFLKAGVQGVIVQPLEFIPDAAEKNVRLMSMFDEAEIPAVLLDCGIVGPDGRSAYDRIGIDNYMAGCLVGRHLAECGAKSVLCCASPFNPESVRNRFAGVRSVVPSVHELEAAPNDFSSLRRALSEHPDTNAIVCQNDVYAVGVMASLRRMKKTVPADVMVAGVDGLHLSRLCTPTLTTISQPIDEIAMVALDCLQRRIAGCSLPPADISLHAPLVVQKSTACKKRRS